MTVTEPPKPTTSFDAPAIAQALRRIGNPGPARLRVRRGRCRADNDYSFPELSLDTSMAHVLDMVDIIECCTPEPHPGARVALQALRKLITNGQLLLCVQRQTMRAGVSFRPAGNDHGGA